MSIVDCLTRVKAPLILTANVEHPSSRELRAHLKNRAIEHAWNPLPFLPYPLPRGFLIAA